MSYNNTNTVIDQAVKALNNPVGEYLCAWPHNSGVRNFIAGVLALLLMKDRDVTIAHKGDTAQQCTYGTSCTRVLAFCFLKKFGVFITDKLRPSLSGCLHIHTQEDTNAVMESIETLCERNDKFQTMAIKAIQNLCTFKDLYKQDLQANGYTTAIYDLSTGHVKPGFVPNIDMSYIFDESAPQAPPPPASGVKGKMSVPKPEGRVIMNPNLHITTRRWALPEECEASSTQSEVARLEREAVDIRREIEALKKRAALEEKRREQQQIIDLLRAERDALRKTMESTKPPQSAPAADAGESETSQQ
jgi:hypothetical protein